MIIIVYDLCLYYYFLPNFSTLQSSYVIQKDYCAFYTVTGPRLDDSCDYKLKGLVIKLLTTDFPLARRHLKFMPELHKRLHNVHTLIREGLLRLMLPF